jgi:hypothetical protein
MKHEVAEADRATLRSMSTPAGIVPLQFVQVTDYTTFRAEYALDGDDFVLHFFKTPEHAKDVNYWLKGFPVALDAVAREHFQANQPRLVAAYTEEMESWWMRAHNYANVIDKDGYIRRFLDKLDQTLDTLTSK